MRTGASRNDSTTTSDLLEAALPGGGDRELRRDARANRERILAAAREAYAVHGVDVPIATIARRAGVGVATLYRRFPSRTALVEAAFAKELDHCVEFLDTALANPDPWRGFCAMVSEVCTLQAMDRGFTGALLARFPDAAVRGRDRIDSRLAELVQRAKDAGKLRADFEPSDLVLVLLANNGVVGESREISLAASRRLVAYLLQSFRADRAGALPPAASVNLEQVGPPRHSR